MTLLVNTIIQIIVFIGAVYLVCFLISIMNRLFYKCVNGNRIVCYATGLIGTPIHELSHAFFCLVFFHKITEIKLFQIDEETGILGYVNHSYNRRNIYHQIGNYFIGVAPIIGGTLVLYFSLNLLVPSVYQNMSSHMDKLSLVLNKGSYDIVPSALFMTLKGFITSFMAGNLTDIRWWLFLIISFCIALHMNLSGADIKGSIIAIPFIAILLLIINFILYFV
ncbi:MAG: hypothetical protein K2K15_03550, partial [Anaeroplasmataceae bacterium]|nr:hypothetical protein [Anaeroplasmataceae bacterium]